MDNKQVNIQKSIEAMNAKRAAKAAAGLTLAWTRAIAVRAKCLDCSNKQVSEVRRCPITRCALYPFRLGATISPAEMKAWEAVFRSSEFGKWFVSGHAGADVGSDTETEKEGK